jgi:hypothetical protein
VRFSHGSLLLLNPAEAGARLNPVMIRTCPKRQARILAGAIEGVRQSDLGNVLGVLVIDELGSMKKLTGISTRAGRKRPAPKQKHSILLK